MSTLFERFPQMLLLLCILWIHEVLCNDSLKSAMDSTYVWPINNPPENPAKYCYDYWGRKNFMLNLHCVYFFHSKVYLGNGNAAPAVHYVSADQDIVVLEKYINRTDDQGLVYMLDDCLTAKCAEGTSWFGFRFRQKTTQYFEYFTFRCCQPPGCYTDEPETIEKALYYPQHVFKSKTIHSASEASSFEIQNCTRNSIRPKSYYVGSQKPLSTGVNEMILITFGQDNAKCNLDTPGNTVVQISNCSSELEDIPDNEKCFSLCLTEQAEANKDGLWAVDYMLLKMLQNAAKREETHCAAYIFTNGSCMILREVATARFLTDESPTRMNLAMEFFHLSDMTPQGSFDYHCYLITAELLNPVIQCNCEGPPAPSGVVMINPPPPCDARMYAREDKVFAGMYEGNWSDVTETIHPVYDLWTASCPHAQNALVFLCEIDFTVTNGVLMNTTQPVTFERLIELRRLAFTRFDDDDGGYYCAEKSGSAEEESTIICVCNVEYNRTYIAPCTETLSFKKGTLEAMKQSGRSVADLDHFTDELQRCLQDPTDENRRDVVDYQAQFLCYYVHRTSKYGIGRRIDQGYCAIDSEYPHLIWLREDVSVDISFIKTCIVSWFAAVYPKHSPPNLLDLNSST